jgi:hypothetical protein
MGQLEQFVEYAKLHLISLEQDASKIQGLLDNFQGDLDSDAYVELEITDIENTGEMAATMHLLSVATDILNDNLQGKGY